jgi:hypothetical protein
MGDAVRDAEKLPPLLAASKLTGGFAVAPRTASGRNFFANTIR